MNFYEIFKRTNLEKAPIKHEILIMSQTLEDSYKRLLRDNEKERKELNETVNKLSIKCRKYKEQITRMTNDLTNFKIKKLKDTQEKSIECNFYKENFIEKASNHLKNLLMNPSENIVSAFKQSREWTSAVITLLLNEKTIADFQDEAEKRPRETLQNFIVEWFLRRFGNKKLAEIFLKDFLLSLRTLAMKSERFRIFSELSNIDWTAGTSDVIQVFSNQNKFNKNVVKPRFMSLNETLKIYMKIIFALQGFPDLKYKEKSLIFPFMPNILIKGQDLLPLETAKIILENVLLEESFADDKLREALIQLKGLIISEDEACSLDEESGNENYHHQNIVEKEQYIRFDYFSRFLLDFVVENKLTEIENIHMALKLKNTMKSEGLITFDDFSSSMVQLYPKKSLRWMESSYRALIDGVKSEATPLNLSLRCFLPLIYNENSACENYSKNKNFFLGYTYNTYVNYVTLSFHERFEMENEENNLATASPSLKKKMQRIDTNPSIASSYQKKKPSAMLRKGLKTIKTIELPKNINEMKNSNVFNDLLAGIFDSISSLSLLEETYKIIKHIIIQSERNNLNLMALHEEFKGEMTKIPNNISKLKSYEIFNNYDRKDLMYLAEFNWKIFRNLLYVCFNF